MEKLVSKKGILVVSFGTSYREVEEVSIQACERKIAQSFPEYALRRAFTSSIIRRILQERDGLFIPDTTQALQAMHAEGFTEVIVQPLHIIPGEEYQEKVLQPAQAMAGLFDKLLVGRPLLATINDYKEVVAALQSQLPAPGEFQAHILMGHGSSHPANACYSCLQLMLYDSFPRVFVGTVEGYPELTQVIPQLKKQGIREVILSPFMLVAGDHALNDLAGNEEESWKSILEREGFAVSVILKGLGEYPVYQDFFVNRIKDCIGGKS